MSLPPGFLDELRSRASLSQVVGRKVMWDARKSNQGKGDMWAPCPFHQEKTASFHVDDRKGFYYCFGCHAKGDAISFVRETENVGFMEAVEILAGEVGMPMPARDPKAQEKADHRSELADVMEQAVQFFRLQLRTGVAGAARDYLAGRGLDEAALERWEIGFAPDGWQGLWDHLRGKGVGEELILGAGLAKPSTKGGRPYNTFRNRIMFPIRNARGRAIAFGGRAMDPSDNAKYLNSPETALFDKGRTLYNHGPAREAVGKGAPLIVAEGYMDVIALSEAGFAGAVAPLGTAITEEQLHLLWRVAPEPIVALDGDVAGLRAAMRLIDLALPLLQAGQSLRFVLLPEGQDPDDILRASGPSAIQTALEGALPMVQLLWRRETEGRVIDSPERRAALDKSLRDAVNRITDPSVKRHYGEAIKTLLWQHYNPRRGFSGKRRRDAPRPPQASTKSSALVAASGAVERNLREAVILATLITTPAVLHAFDDQLEAMECHDPDHRALRDLLMRHNGTDGGALRDDIAARLGPDVVETLLRHPHVALCPSVRRPGDVEFARLAIAEELAKLDAERGLTMEIAEAAQDLAGMADEALTWRLGQAAEARNNAMRSADGESEDFEIGDNGARISRDERQSFDALLEKITFDKRRR